MSRAARIFRQVTFPLWLPFLLIWTAIVHYSLQRRWLINQMRAAGRYLSPDEISARIRLTPGTIIVDSAAFNHVRMHVWWTPDDVLTLAPSKPPESYMDDVAMQKEPEAKSLKQWICDFDYWICSRYLDPTTGTAFLLDIKVQKWLTLAQVKSKYPNCSVVRSRSGWVEAIRLGSGRVLAGGVE